MNPKIVWTDDVLNFIIQYVQATPYVWNPSNRNFNNKRRKAKFWDDLAKKINSYGEFRSQNPNLTRDILSRKWNNMKSYYVAERNKLDAMKRGENIDDDPEAEALVWKFMPAMSFLNARGVRECYTKKDIKTDTDENISDASFDQYEDSYDSSLDPLSATKTAIEVNTLVSPLPQIDSDQNIDNCHVVDNLEDNADEDCFVPYQEQTLETTKAKGTPTRRKMNSSYYHYAMTIAQDLDELDEDLKVDAKLEIMQIVAKHKKEHLRIDRNRINVKRETV